MNTPSRIRPHSPYPGAPAYQSAQGAAGAQPYPGAYGAPAGPGYEPADRPADPYGAHGGYAPAFNSAPPVPVAPPPAPAPQFNLPQLGPPYGQVAPFQPLPSYPQQPPAAQAPPRPAPPAGPPGPQHRAMLVVDGTGRQFDLRTGANVIGRGSESDLQLLDQGVSRKHINIDFDGSFATIYDLGSTNGTSVNGHHVASQLLRHGDVIRVGHTKLVFQQDYM